MTLGICLLQGPGGRCLLTGEVPMYTVAAVVLILMLSWSGEQIGRLGVQALGGGLRTNRTLVSLNLGENFFGDEVTP